MKKLIAFLFFVSFSWLASAAETPTDVAKEAVGDILKIAQNKDQPEAQRKEALQSVIGQYVDLQACSQRVLALYWRQASDEQKRAFMKVFEQVLTNTYFTLLQNYTNEAVTFKSEDIQRKRYATVESIVLSQGKEIPVNYLLLQRNDQWKIYDFMAEGVSVVRSFSSDYQGILRTKGIDGLIDTLKAKLAEGSKAEGAK
ncbi:MlaC/ttg2D family ABC transporter substrate-binding protein [Gallaecimonas pentaromativorans]|uniref:MlaC/ttg2D family ABC transporter substrate-binding protein n=1 Tax=Gallaecimonas pentaromativorans TaxID=584787 RepID=UPI003A95B40E